MPNPNSRHYTCLVTIYSVEVPGMKGRLCIPAFLHDFVRVSNFARHLFVRDHLTFRPDEFVFK